MKNSMQKNGKKNICKTPSTLALKITKDIYFLFSKTLGKPTAFTFQSDSQCCSKILLLHILCYFFVFNIVKFAARREE